MVSGSAGRGVAAAAVAALLLTGCAANAAPASIDLERAGCPDTIVIRLDALPRIEAGALYRLLDADDLQVGGKSVTAPLVVDGTPTGVDLRLISGDRYDGDAANKWLHRDHSTLLAAVDSDRALLDLERYPVVGVFAPTARDTAIVYWDDTVYGNVRGVTELRRTLTPDSAGRVPIATTPRDPAIDWLVIQELLLEEQIRPENAGTATPFLDGGGVIAQQGDLLIDPPRFDELERSIDYDVLEESTYPRYTGMLAARPDTIVRYADCLAELVPILQRSAVDYLEDPEPTIELVAELAMALGDESYDLDVATEAYERALDARVFDDGRTPTVGDIEVGRLQLMLDRALPVFPGVDRDTTPGHLATDAFIDPDIEE